MCLETKRVSRLLAGVILCGVVILCGQRRVFGQPYPEIEFQPSDRILILAPHPDDEILGCAGVLQRATAKNIPLRIVFFTYGDNNEWSFLVYRKYPVLLPRSVRGMGLVRHDEAVAAEKTLGIPADHINFLGYPDFRTLTIWHRHWRDVPPARSMLTNTTYVPYSNAWRPKAAYKGEEILKDLESILLEFKPTKIFVSHPGDHNPDHKALYLFARVAVWDLKQQISPVFYPYMVHYVRWPVPGSYHPDVPLEPPPLYRESNVWSSLTLNEEEIKGKLDALKQHRSQFNSDPPFFLKFIRGSELFGDFPETKVMPDASVIPLSPQSEDNFKELPEQLINEERLSFIGVQKRSVFIKDNQLVIFTKLSRPLGRQVGFTVYVFGYRQDKAFAQMPKLRIMFGKFRHSIYDLDRKLPLTTLEVERTSREITVHIPLEALDNPQRILTSARTYLGLVPLDWVSWQVLNVDEVKQ